MGSEDLNSYLKKYNLSLDPYFEGVLTNHSKKTWDKFINAENQHMCNADVLDFIDKLLVFDHAERILPKEAMEHQWLAPVKEMWR
jgi:casein kinase II subunit alpha